MNNSNLCPQCGKPISRKELMGVCPDCLLKAGLGSLADETAVARTVSFDPPPVSDIAERFPQLDILGLIGCGGMGAVYKARQKALDRLVALKILPPAVSRDPSFAERFAREAKVLAKLSHPNIVTLYEFGESGGLYYFLMEYVEGVNLRQVLSAGRTAPNEALAIVPQICEALQFAHDRNIVHRDIKPENILLNKDGQVKIADFGVAKIVGGGVPSEGAAPSVFSDDSVEVTEAGSVIGTPRYMSPEQRERPETVDHRADIYSLGVVFYQMLTGELPAQKLVAPSKKVLIDVRLDEVVLRTLDRDPDRRYQHASEVKTIIETVVGTREALAEAGSFDGRPESVPRDGESPRLSRAAIVGACWAPFVLFAVLAVMTIKVGPVSHTVKSIPTSLQPLFLFQLLLAGMLAIGITTKVRAVTWWQKAAVGFCWVVVMMMVAPMGVQIIGDGRGLPSWQTLSVILLTLVSATAPFGTTILGWLGVAQIRRSGGRLCGLELAVFDGLLFPLLALDAMIVSGGVTQKVPVLALAFVVGLVDVLLVRWVWKAVSESKDWGAQPCSGSPSERPTPQKINRWKRTRLLASMAAGCCIFAAMTVAPLHGQISFLVPGLFVIATALNIAAAIHAHGKIQAGQEGMCAGAFPAAGGSSPSVVPQSGAQDSEGTALTSLLLGILSFFGLGPVASIPAVICGHIAQARIRKAQGQVSGGGMALAGLILGYLNMALTLMLVGLFIVFLKPSLTHARENAKRINCLQEIGLSTDTRRTEPFQSSSPMLPKQELPKTPHERFSVLDTVAIECFFQGKLDLARRYAKELTELLPAFKEDPHYGDAFHNAKMVLGLVAVREGDIDAAKRYLAESVQTPGSASMKMFGPNMALAKVLLDKEGERTAVLAYLEACRRIWTNQNGLLDKWIREVKDGKTPSFDVGERQATVTLAPTAFTPAADSIQWTAETVVTKANAVAEKAGYHLKDYLLPRVTLSSESSRFTVDYTHKDPATPGSHFTVRIDIGSGKAELIPGE